jgi:hypothetical protein
VGATCNSHAASIPSRLLARSRGIFPITRIDRTYFWFCQVDSLSRQLCWDCTANGAPSFPQAPCGLSSWNEALGIDTLHAFVHELRIPSCTWITRARGWALHLEQCLVAKNSSGARNPSRIRLIVLDAELGDGDIGQITQAITNALRPPVVNANTVVKRIAAPAPQPNGEDAEVIDPID